MPKRKDTATFVAQARAIHGDRYDYSRVEYVTCRKRVKIICPVHGEFQQTPDLHRKGRNCRKCSSLKATFKKASFCRFCGQRYTYGYTTKKRCGSAECKQKHAIEIGRKKTGNDWLDVIGEKWSKEKQRQANNAWTGWKRKCRATSLSLWNCKRYRKPVTPKLRKICDGWDESITRSRCRLIKEATEQNWSGWYRKIVVFCRESSQGRRGMSARKGNVSRTELFTQLERQRYRCALSGLELTVDNATADHITPVQKGGETKIENIQWLHGDFNRMKGTMTNDEFIEACRLVVEHTLPPPPHPLLGSS